MIQVTSTIEARDWSTLVAAGARLRAAKREFNPGVFFFWLVVFSAAAAFHFLPEIGLQAGAFLLGCAVVGIGAAGLQFLSNRKASPAAPRTALGPRTIIFSDDGITEESEFCRLHYKWGLVRQVLECDQNLLLLYDEFPGTILRKQDLPDDTTLQQVDAFIETKTQVRVSYVL